MHSGYASSLKSTKTAKVEGLWLTNWPKCFVPEHPDDSYNSPEVQLHSPFIVPPFYSMRDPCDVISWHHDRLLQSSSGKTTVHVHWNCHGSSANPLASMSEHPNIMKALNLIISFLIPFPCLWHIYIYENTLEYIRRDILEYILYIRIYYRIYIYIYIYIY